MLSGLPLWKTDWALSVEKSRRVTSIEIHIQVWHKTYLLINKYETPNALAFSYLVAG